MCSPGWFAEARESQLNPYKNISSRDIFPLSVASGDPTQHGFVLMTHLSIRHLCKENKIRLEISDSEFFSEPSVLIKKDILISIPSNLQRINDYLIEATSREEYERMTKINETFNPDEAQEVVIKEVIYEPEIITGSRYYYYRFSYCGMESDIGRAKALPSGSPDSLKIAVITCQDYTSGKYNVFYHLAKEEGIDLVFHSGDVIYEYNRYPGLPSASYSKEINFPDGVLSLAPEADVRKANTLADFRYIYRKEKSNPDFQEALRKHTWVFIRDDHDSGADNIFWDDKSEAPGFPDHDVRRNWPARARNRVMKNALQAWTEFIPMDVTFHPETDSPQEVLSTYFKSYNFGDLAELFLLEGRIFRTPENPEEGLPGSMLGKDQKRWLIDGVRHSRANWQLIGNQTLMAPLRLKGGTGKILRQFVDIDENGAINRDAWDGFSDERRQILEAFSEKSNIAVFTGDMHTSLVSYLKKNFEKGADRKNNKFSDIIGAEFMTPSLTSPNFSDSIRFAAGISGFTVLTREIFECDNPHIKHFHGGIYGYATAVIRKERLDWFVYKINKIKEKTKTKKTLRKYLWYRPSTRKIGKMDKFQLLGRDESSLLSKWNS